MQAPITLQPNLIIGFRQTQLAGVTAADVDVMARTIFGEARGETYYGKLAVGWSIRNRVTMDLWGDKKPDWWGETISGVCLKKWQYTCHSDHNAAKLAKVSLDDDAFKECFQAALCVITGWVPDPVFGATHYQVVGTNAKWSIGHKPILTIGHHEFFVGIEPGDPKHKGA